MPGTRLRGFSSGVILVMGVMVVPIAIGLAFNSYAAPDAAAYVRMAFATVAGSTIAIVTVIGLVIQRITRRSPPLDIAWFAVLAAVIISVQINLLTAAADVLLSRLGLSG